MHKNISLAIVIFCLSLMVDYNDIFSKMFDIVLAY